MAPETLRVCYFGTYRAEYSRNRILIEGLRRNGVAVVECHVQLWQSFDDRVQAVRGSWKQPRFWWRVLRTYGQVLWRYWQVRNRYDILIVAYPGQFDIFLARFLSRWQGKPLVWDILMSIYLISLERGLDREHGRVVSLLRRIEYRACRLADLMLLDSQAYIDWFCQTHSLTTDRFRIVPTGADSDRLHTNRPNLEPPGGQEPHFCILYYGNFLATHGVDVIVEAARLLQDDERFRFELIGVGPEREAAMQKAEAYGLRNVTFPGWVDDATLIRRISQADLCLGVFGTTPQASISVQNKIYEGMAMGRPVISADGPAVRGVFTHREHIYLCERNNPQALAEGIRELQANADLRLRLAVNGHALFQERFTIESLGRLYKQYLLELLERVKAKGKKAGGSGHAAT